MTAEIVRIGRSMQPSVENVRTALLEAVADLDRGELKACKVALIFLNEENLDSENRTYELRLRTCGMRASELLGLFEVAKTRALAWMGLADR